VLQFKAAGYEVTICSLLGGDATKNVDPQSLNGFDKDTIKKEFWENADNKTMLSTLQASTWVMCRLCTCTPCVIWKCPAY